MAVSRRLRFEILARDGHTCRYCGAAAPDVKLTVDHVIPVALGGGDEPNNLVTACADCNSGKSSMSPGAQVVEDVDAAAMLFGKAMERAAEIRTIHRQIVNDQVARFEHYWTGWYYDGNKDDHAPRDQDWEQSVRRFMSLGLEIEDLIALAQEAFDAVGYGYVWKSFCRRSWDEIKDRQELARRLIEDGEV